jgi:hypothetical protein
MLDKKLTFLELALEKVSAELEEMMVGMEERKKGDQDVDGVRTGEQHTSLCNQLS